MTHLFTMSRKMEDGRTSNWRFIKTDDGLCSIGGNYKLLQYRNETGMNKSIQWFKSKGYTVTPA